MNLNFHKNTKIKYLPFLMIFVCLLVLFSCMAKKPSENKKINGISLVASRDKLIPANIAPIKKLNANAVALMPYSFMKAQDSADLYFNMEHQFYGERVEGIREAVKSLHSQGIQVMLKPHIWIRHGEFTGNIKMKSEDDWQKFEKNYSEFVLLYAKIASEENVEFLCLGTELSTFVQQRSAFWKRLIIKVRDVYKGKITYAENWDKVGKVSFWEKLDFIGVDAYFPLNSERSPSLEQLKTDWQPHKSILKNLANSNNKPILFTEFGYRSMDYATKTPWDSSREILAVNTEEQVIALKALFQEFWGENWFAGGFLWKWHQDYDNAGGLNNNQFTIQNKPAEKMVREFYANH